MIDNNNDMASIWEKWVSSSIHCSCGSAAINMRMHSRQPMVDLDLCDVCYWRKRAECPDYVGRDWSEFVSSSPPRRNR